MEEDKYVPDLETYAQEKEFWNKSSKEYVTMSDGAELLCFYTRQEKKPSGITILFGPGYGTGIPSWTDLWDELSPHYDFFVFDSREKSTSKVKWRHKADMDRLGQDIQEIVNHFKFNERKLIIISARSTFQIQKQLNGVNIPFFLFVLHMEILF